MQDCCKWAPRRARFVVIVVVILAAVAVASFERGGAEATAPAQAAGPGR